MTVWFTSDVHFGHRVAAAHRGFDDVTEHDRIIFDRWSAAVRPTDQVWVLGDIAVSSPTYALALIDRLPGEKHLITGNHEKCHPMHRDAHRHIRPYMDVFASVQSSARRRINGTEVLLSHFPYHRDRDTPRHTQWRLRNEGRWLLHGHTHGTERATVGRVAMFGPPTREIHVGVDAWDLAPVSLDTIAGLMADNAVSGR